MRPRLIDLPPPGGSSTVDAIVHTIQQPSPPECFQTAKGFKSSLPALEGVREIRKTTD